MIILLVLIMASFAIYCTKLEMDYRLEMKRRSLKIGEQFVYWEGVPGYQTNLIVLDKYGCKVESIPFIQHYQAISHSRRSLEDFYRGMMKRHNRKKAQEQHEHARKKLIEDCRAKGLFESYEGDEPRNTTMVHQSIESLNRSSQAGGHDW